MLQKAFVFGMVTCLLSALTGCLPMTNTPTTVGARPAGAPAAASVPTPQTQAQN